MVNNFVCVFAVVACACQVLPIVATIKPPAITKEPISLECSDKSITIMKNGPASNKTLSVYHPKSDGACKPSSANGRLTIQVGTCGYTTGHHIIVKLSDDAALETVSDLLFDVTCINDPAGSSIMRNVTNNKPIDVASKTPILINNTVHNQLAQSKTVMHITKKNGPVDLTKAAIGDILLLAISTTGPVTYDTVPMSCTAYGDVKHKIELLSNGCSKQMNVFQNFERNERVKGGVKATFNAFRFPQSDVPIRFTCQVKICAFGKCHLNPCGSRMRRDLKSAKTALDHHMTTVSAAISVSSLPRDVKDSATGSNRGCLTMALVAPLAAMSLIF